MKITGKVSIWYIADSSKEAVRLEKAVKKLPMKISFFDLAQFGASPKLVVSSAHDGEIILRPYLCRISKVSINGESQKLSDPADMKRVILQKQKYIIANIPVFHKDWR